MTKVPPKSKLSQRKRWMFRLGILICASLVGLVAAELFLRLFIEQETKRLAIYDPDLGWRGRPMGKGLYVERADGIRVRFRYNNLGYRDEDVLPKTPDQRRLMVVGDSFVENLEVPFEESYPALLEANCRRIDPNWDVVTIGSQGYSTAQELLAFRKYRDEVQPDLVLLFFYCGNDFDDNLRPDFAYLDEEQNLQLPENNESQWRVWAKQFQRFLYESSHVVFLLKNRLESWGVAKVTPAAKKKIDADEEYQLEITRKLILQFAFEVKGIGADFAVVVIPYRDDLAQGQSEKSDWVKVLCQQNEIACLDLAESLKVEDYFPTNVHFNPPGHARVAEALFQFVQSQLLHNERSSDGDPVHDGGD